MSQPLVEQTEGGGCGEGIGKTREGSQTNTPPPTPSLHTQAGSVVMSLENVGPCVYMCLIFGSLLETPPAVQKNDTHTL